MTWTEIYTEIKGWQGAIGSLLGFGALLFGALFNFRLNRIRDKRLRDEEVIAIASALYAEILLTRKSVAHMANVVGKRFVDHGLGRVRGEPFSKHFLEMIELPELKLYPVLADKVGMLPSFLAMQIVTFYANVEEAKTWLPRLTEDEQRPHSYGVMYVLDPAIDAIIKVTPALRRIEKIAAIEVVAETPDITAALDGQSVEKEMNDAMGQR